ncbi:Intracellular septation protein A [Thioclava sp. SK-1]|uniref:inner membrane-spanning protein YciB n=1 Tax=Thioclava sp. SK-1 TaxID=1889770 RepID=UPI000825DCBB|nr:inner membrane-spanning protein YciB [Thioclava sp. SK-1]OCX66024.1 Intracellular septation protein A [Thioclava sp. SK-1]
MAHEPSTGKTISPALKAVLEFGPIVAFFVTYMKIKDDSFLIHGVEYSGFVLATAAFIPLIVISTLLLWRLTGRLAPMQIATLVLVVVFGGLSVWLNDPKFFKMKPTIIYLLFSGLLFYGLWRDKPWLKLVMEGSLPMRHAGWVILTRRLALLFLGLAIANEVIWRTMSEEAWVNFKTFGLTGLMFVFFMAQGGLIKTYGIDKDATGDGE